MNFFPFHALGFRCNPFRSLTHAEWAALAVLPNDWVAILEKAAHLQILGEKGVGKTTLLLFLQAHLASQGQLTTYEYLPEGQSRFLTKPAALDAFFLDEAQRLNNRQRQRLIRFTGGSPSLARLFLLNHPSRHNLRLVLASHEDLTRLFVHAGLPLETVQIHNTIDHLRLVIEKRLSSFSLAGTSPINLDQGAVDLLYRCFNADYRAALDCLYDVFQNRLRQSVSLPGMITPEHIRAVIGPGVVQE